MEPFLVNETAVTKRIGNCAEEQIRNTHAGHIPQEHIGAKLFPGTNDEQQGQVGDDSQDADNGNGCDDRGTVQFEIRVGVVFGGDIVSGICRWY